MTATKAVRAQLDMFGEVPITRPDVYAWLLAVVDLDPESNRAGQYVQTYAVVDKIVAAKLDGTFDTITEASRLSARYRELAAADQAGAGVGNIFSVGEAHGIPPHQSMRLTPKPRRRRSPEAIRRERERTKIEQRQRRKASESLLDRVPTRLPGLPTLLEDLGGPDAEALAAALQVHATTVRRWLRKEIETPYVVRIALFWLTRWGVSSIEANAHNDALQSARVAALRELEASELREQLAKVVKLADFGSANDPAQPITPRWQGPAYHFPELPEPEPVETAADAALSIPAATPAVIPLVITSIRRAPCADSVRKKRNA
jgi:hypothetical protein